MATTAWAGMERPCTALPSSRESVWRFRDGGRSGSVSERAPPVPRAANQAFRVDAA